MRNKKGALALSINAIVILIIAITMLGLALGFTRGMFGKISTQIEEKVSEEPEPPIPTVSDPITMSRESIVTTAGEDEIIKIGVYNPGCTDCGTVAENAAGITCSGFKDDYKNSVQAVPANEYKIFTVITTGADAANTYLCQIVVGANSKDFTVRVSQ